MVVTSSKTMFTYSSNPRSVPTISFSDYTSNEMERREEESDRDDDQKNDSAQSEREEKVRLDT